MLKTLTAYKRWANQELFDCLLELPPEVDHGKRHMMIRLLNHVYVVDRIFQAHLLGQPHTYTALNTPQTPGLEDLWQDVQAVDDWYVAYAEQLDISCQQ